MNIEKFTDLVAWKEGHKLVLMVYRETKSFPADEKFGLINQMRRAAVSVTSNIAEGFSRSTPNDQNQFFGMALGSLTELQSQLLIARDLRYNERSKFQLMAEQSVQVHKLINGLIKYNKNKKILSRK